MDGSEAPEKARANTAGRITDVEGIRVGHSTDEAALTGCTVVLCDEPMVGAVAVRGGAPGTRETDLLRPGRLVEPVDAILLTGGSAFGLAAADGVMRWLHARGRGYDARVARVPIVPGAVIFDLGVGTHTWPGPDAGLAACDTASTTFAEGSVGAGTGATVGKLLGPTGMMKGGVGTAAITVDGRWRVGAIAVVNAFGDIVAPESGRIIAGARDTDGRFVNTVERLLTSASPRGVASEASGGNTTIVVVATDARLDCAQATHLAEAAHNGIALAVRPSHTLVDGDTIFTLASGRVEEQADPVTLGVAASTVVTRAIIRAVEQATSLGGIVAVGDLAQ